YDAAQHKSQYFDHLEFLICNFKNQFFNVAQFKTVYLLFYHLCEVKFFKYPAGITPKIFHNVIKQTVPAPLFEGFKHFRIELGNRTITDCIDIYALLQYTRGSLSKPVPVLYTYQFIMSIGVL